MLLFWSHQQPSIPTAARNSMPPFIQCGQELIIRTFWSPGCKAEIWLFRDRWQKLHFLESKSRLSLHLCMFDDKNRLIFNSKYFYLINLFLHILKLKKMGFICKITDVTFVLQDQKFLITLLVWRVPWINVINRTDRKCEAQTSSTPTNIT